MYYHKGGKKIKDKPLVGFFPCFYTMGETLPQVKIAKKYIEKGGEGIFFSHGGKYEHLAEEIGCEVIKLKGLEWRKAMAEVDIFKIPVEKRQFLAHNKKTIGPLVESEIEAFKKTGINLVLSSFNPTSSISARALNIPLVVLISGTFISPYFQQGLATFPENYENVFTKMLPLSLKNMIIRWILLNNRYLVRDFNRDAEKYNVKRFRTLNDILEGDHTLIGDDINLLGIKPTNKFPIENFIGPISAGLLEKREDKLDEDIKKHLERPGKSILFIMGSSPAKKLFPKILDTLNQTDYNVIVVYTIIPDEKLFETKENILLKQFIKYPQIVNNMVDLAIIQGGRGTVYNAAYSGKPSIGIPIFIEPQYNIDNLVRRGAGLRISGKYFKPDSLLQAINTIFNNYDAFLKNAKELSTKLTRVPGEEKAAQRLVEIFNENVKK